MSSDNDCVRVAVRIRPLVKSEIDRDCRVVIDKLPSEPQIIVNKNDAFRFNYVFASDDRQELVYKDAVYEMLDKLFEGYNVTILAYGQTGSGKTHTIGTAFNGQFDEETGVIPRAMQDIFRRIERSSDTEYKVACSFMELYQEQLFDLLSSGSREQSVVDIREDRSGIIIPNLTEIEVSSALETTNCLMKGSSGRAVGATAMNQQSSRSHAIFTVTIQMQKKDDSKMVIKSKFHLVDLAGSERSKKTKATGDRFKEGVKINQGLLALGNVISALGTTQGNGYVSYRDSKLTRLLQDSLGGNSVTLMIACVSPADYNAEETLSTLRYADRARKIKNKPIVNQDSHAAEISRLNGIIQKLRMELLNKGCVNGMNESGSAGGAAISTQELELMRKNQNNLMEKYRNLQQQFQATLHDVAEIEMRAVVAEAANEELQQKVANVHGTLTELHNEFNENNCPPEVVQYAKKVTDVTNFVAVINGILEKSKEEILNHKKSFSASMTASMGNESDVNNEAMQQKLDAFTTKQMDFNNELRRINRELILKEELQQKVAGNLSKFCVYDNEDNVEEKIKESESKIQILEAEKSDLLDKLKHVKEAASAKLAEERRKRVQQLEHDINELKKRNLQQAKVLKVREKESQKIDNLTREIQAMKAAKVKLIRAMRTESDNFRQWKLSREKQLTQLKEKDRKRQNEMARMESLHNKQRNVLKRKVEEAMAINKRLKDALEKQKIAQSQRSKHGANTKIDQVLSWVDHELEVIMSVVDAENSLEQLREDREMIMKRLQDLKTADPHAKKDLAALDEELEMRNAQINDLQQKVNSTDIQSKMKGICDSMQSMPEARAVLKHLFSAITAMRREYAGKDGKIDEFKSACEAADEKIEMLEKEIKMIENKRKEDLSTIEKNYEEKIAILLREMAGTSKSEVKTEEWTKIQEETFEKLETLREELDSYKHRCEEMETLLHFKKPKKSVFAAVKAQVKTEAYDSDISFGSEVENEVDNSDEDPDWKMTPIIRKRSKSNNTSKGSITIPNTSEESILKNEKSGESFAVKRSADGTVRCSCKTGCKTLRCSCRQSEKACSSSCKCSETCVNVASDSSMEEEKENNLMNGDDENNISAEHTPKKQKISFPDDTKLNATSTTISHTPQYPKKKKPFFQ